MSGFVGMIHFDGAAADPGLLRNLTNSLSFRGPDAQDIWFHGEAGLGHALLRISTEGPMERQPAQLENRLWIVADARIDARGELIAALKGKNESARAVSLTTSDAELILHAYDAWGEACADHLLGDFSFAIWDARQKKLFCARDHFGVKPFFYAQAGACLIFSNTLNCVRMHPAVSSRLNDLAIADFLLFDANQDLSTTPFADIRQLPPAHTIHCDGGNLFVKRYWKLPEASSFSSHKEADCVRIFRELLDTAVSDRLRGSGPDLCNVGIMMTGGLDSTAVAASAQRVLARNGQATGVRAYTEVLDSLIPHKERHYATLAANAMKIPIEYLVSDGRKIFERGEEPGYRLPIPMHLAWPDTSTDQLQQIAAHSRIALTGFGADPAFSARITVHFRELIQRGRFVRLLADAGQYLARPGRMSRLYLRTRWERLFPPQSLDQPYPSWLNPDLEKSLSLQDRWTEANDRNLPNRSVRPEAYELVGSPDWVSLFEVFDTSITQVPVEVRHPFFDLRLLQFLLSLPRLPWCCDKQLLRESARDSLPDEVRLRRKSPMPAELLNAVLQKPESAWVDYFEPVAVCDRYVLREKIALVYREKGAWTAWVHLRPLSLNFWLRLNDF